MRRDFNVIGFKVQRAARASLALVAGLALLAAQALPVPPEPWRARGDEAAAAYDAYVKRLGAFHSALVERLKAEAPDLLTKSRKAAPAPRPAGYQVLPGLLPEKPPPATLPRARIAGYSWPWTKTMIAGEEEKLRPLEVDLARAASLPPSERPALYETILAAYEPLATSHFLIDSHVRYNRLWQESIASNRELYDGQTQLAQAVLERQSIQDALAANPPHADPATRAREAELARRIHDATDAITPLPCLRVEHPAPHRWIVRVPVVTDIEDRRFLEAFRSAVEMIWHVNDGEGDYSVIVAFRRLSPGQLYRGSGARAPRRGATIDLARHLPLFPEGAAILTTGASATHVTGRSIVLGPSDIAPHDLAHEFGHILGFQDVYFRGYKDLGEDGFEVQEVIADPGDIMGAPGSGPVRKGQFERLIAQLAH